MEQPKADADQKANTVQSKAEAEEKAKTLQSPAQQPSITDVDPASDGDGFVIVSASENEKQVQTQNQNQSQSEPQIQSEPTTNRSASVSKKSVHWSPKLVSESPAPDYNNVSPPSDSNPYVAHTLAPASPSLSIREKMETVKDVIGRWRRKVGEATKKAEDLAGNTWQHLKTSPSFAEAAMGRIAQGTKVLAEGGYEKIFRQAFETVPEEQLQNSYVCYLSTSAGPVMGTLYVSTAKLAYCSDNPLSYKNGSQTEWSYYKVIIPLHQLKAVNPSSSRANPAEKYIQVVSVDGHEFWFMGFLNFEGAVHCLLEALGACNS